MRARSQKKPEPKPTIPPPVQRPLPPAIPQAPPVPDVADAVNLSVTDIFDFADDVEMVATREIPMFYARHRPTPDIFYGTRSAAQKMIDVPDCVYDVFSKREDAERFRDTGEGIGDW